MCERKNKTHIVIQRRIIGGGSWMFHCSVFLLYESEDKDSRGLYCPKCFIFVIGYCSYGASASASEERATRSTDPGSGLPSSPCLVPSCGSSTRSAASARHGRLPEETQPGVATARPVCLERGVGRCSASMNFQLMLACRLDL